MIHFALFVFTTHHYGSWMVWVNSLGTVCSQLVCLLPVSILDVLN